MKKIRFILHGYGQCGVDVYKDYYYTEIVEVSDRAYELLTGELLTGGKTNINFMGAEKIKSEGEDL